jgi:hypothetical protein
MKHKLTTKQFIITALIGIFIAGVFIYAGTFVFETMPRREDDIAARNNQSVLPISSSPESEDGLTEIDNDSTAQNSSSHYSINELADGMDLRDINASQKSIEARNDNPATNDDSSSIMGPVRSQLKSENKYLKR